MYLKCFLDFHIFLRDFLQSNKAKKLKYWPGLATTFHVKFIIAYNLIKILVRSPSVEQV